ncbi:hypothetical protein DFR51_2461 [Sphingosinicella microcystinivorans]|uniref:Uncharacterized protein n=1 Tax=Sphingosinicella microcystinivorans TaxID=335406 RepID=A0ABX9SZJ2_SPHMI|nr:hypothetical protein DFR51_2461 [Sphingosinicella microcystinivorans]
MDQLVIGAEIEFAGLRDGLSFDWASAILMWRFTDPEEKPVGLVS